jgi:hypothetical protein
MGDNRLTGCQVAAIVLAGLISLLLFALWKKIFGS